MRDAEADVGIRLRDVEDVMRLRPQVAWRDAAVDQERHVPLAREIEKDAALMRQPPDVRLNDRALDLDAVEAVVAAQLHQFARLRLAVAHRVHHHEGQRAPARLGKKPLALLQQPAVLESIGHLLQLRARAEADRPRAESRGIHRGVGDERKHDPVRHPERAAFLLHRDELLRVGEIAVQVEQQVGSDVVVAVDEHGRIRRVGRNRRGSRPDPPCPATCRAAASDQGRRSSAGFAARYPFRP